MSKILPWTCVPKWNTIRGSEQQDNHHTTTQNLWHKNKSWQPTINEIYLEWIACYSSNHPHTCLQHFMITWLHTTWNLKHLIVQIHTGSLVSCAKHVAGLKWPSWSWWNYQNLILRLSFWSFIENDYLRFKDLEHINSHKNQTSA